MVLNPSSSTCVNEDASQVAAAVPTLQARKQQLVREAIWDAATRLFAERGFNETTVDDIAQAAGVSRRTFFRYFSSKGDLMAEGIISYATTLTDAIDDCPATDSLSQVFRKTVLRVAQGSAAHPRTREIMAIATKYPAAREAQLSRMAELQDRVAGAFARRCRRASEDDLTPGILAGLTLSVLSVTFRSWFEQGQQDISITADQVFAILDHLICDERLTGKRARKNVAPVKRKRLTRR